MPSVSTDFDPRLAQILLAEAANQGPEGMSWALDTIYNRAQHSGRTMVEEATKSALNKKGVRVYQFTGAGRPDLEDFYERQPLTYRRLAEELIRERGQKDFVPTHPYRFYVTQDFWENRGTLAPDHWVRKMEVGKRIGDHVFLVEAKRPRQ